MLCKQWHVHISAWLYRLSQSVKQSLTQRGLDWTATCALDHVTLDTSQLQAATASRHLSASSDCKTRQDKSTSLFLYFTSQYEQWGHISCHVTLHYTCQGSDKPVQLVHGHPQSERVDSLWHISTIRLYSAIHVGTRWKIQDSRQIKHRHTTKTKHSSEKVNNAKYSRTKLAWFSRLIRHSAGETRWVYSAKLSSPHVAWTSTDRSSSSVWVLQYL